MQTATVTVTNSKGVSAKASVNVNVTGCMSCFFPDPPCPTISIESFSFFTDPDVTHRGELIRFHAVVQTDAYFTTRPDYRWTVNNATIIKGQSTPWIEIESTGEPGESVTVRVEVEGFDPSCSKGASFSVPIKP